MTDFNKASIININEIFKILTSKEIAKYGLICEVIWSAMEYLKANPTKSIKEALEAGKQEWIK